MDKLLNLLRPDWRNPVSIVVVSLLGITLGYLTTKYTIKTPILLLGALFAFWMMLNLDLGLLILFSLTIFIYYSSAFLMIVAVLGTSWFLKTVITKTKIILTPQLKTIICLLGFIVLQGTVFGLSYSFHVKIFAKYLLVFIILVTYIQSYDQLKHIITAIVLAGVFMAATGIVEYLLHFSFLPRKPSTQVSMLSQAMDGGGVSSVSSLFLLNIRNSYVFSLMFSLLLGFGLTLNALNNGKKLFWAASMSVLLVGFILPMSKTAIIAMGVVFAIVFLRRTTFKVKALSGLVSLFLIPFIPWSKITSFLSAIYNAILDPASMFSWSVRIRLWEVGWNLFTESPIFGAGVGKSITATSHIAQKFMGATAPLHNVYLTIVSEIGIVGLLIYFTIVFFTFQDIIWCRNYFKTQKNIEMRNIAFSLLITLIAILIVQIAQPFLYDYPFWYLVIFTSTLKQIAIREIQQNKKNFSYQAA